MKDSKFTRMMCGASLLRQQFAQYRGGVFSQVLGAGEIANIVATHVQDFRERIYPPLDTLRLFIGQVWSADRACQDVVGRRLSERVAQGKSESTLNTGSYCEARARLRIEVPMTLGIKIGERLESMAPRAWRWRGRAVKLFDGTSVSMPDTPSLQQAFPQNREQKPGLGFPVARIGALIGLASGTVLGYQIAACEGKGSGEQNLLRGLLDHIERPGTYCSPTRCWRRGGLSKACWRAAAMSSWHSMDAGSRILRAASDWASMIMWLNGRGHRGPAP